MAASTLLVVATLLGDAPIGTAASTLLGHAPIGAAASTLLGHAPIGAAEGKSATTWPPNALTTDSATGALTFLDRGARFVFSLSWSISLQRYTDRPV